jgi:hypothetical protein
VRQWAEYDWGSSCRPHFTAVLICDDPQDLSIEALAAAREIQAIGAGMRFERPGSSIVIFGWG